MSHGVSKVAAERNQKALAVLVSEPGNDVCADCKARNPRWASWNLGIFICMQCAAIHRKIGTHVTKGLKSLTLDTWTKDQVNRMREVGNIKSNAYYHPDEIKNRPPTNMIEQERDSELEKYIRGKYEFKKFLDKKSIVAAQLGPSRSRANVNRAISTPLTSSRLTASATAPSLSNTKSQTLSLSKSTPVIPPRVETISRSSSQPVSMSLQYQQPPVEPQRPPGTNSSTWDDLISLQEPAQNSSLPLQFAPQLAPSYGTPSLISTVEPVNFNHPNSNPHFNLQTLSNPYMPQLPTTPENSKMNFSSGYNAIGTQSSFPGPPFSNAVPQNPFAPGQMYSGTPVFQPQLFQPQQQQFQPQPMPTSLPTMPAPSGAANIMTNPFFSQQMQPGAFLNTQPQPNAFAPPLAYSQQQQPNQFMPGNLFGGGWQGQSNLQGGVGSQQRPWG